MRDSRATKQNRVEIRGNHGIQLGLDSVNIRGNNVKQDGTILKYKGIMGNKAREWK